MKRSIYDSDERTTPAVEAVMAEIASRSRVEHAERYAPDGEQLINYPGDSWIERRAAWYREHGYPEVPA